MRPYCPMADSLRVGLQWQPRELMVTVSSFALRWCAEQVSLWCVNDLRLEGRPGWCCRRLCGCGWRGGWVLLFTEHIQSSGTSSPISSVTGRLLVLVVGVQKHTAPFARWVSRSYIWSCHLPPHNHPAGCRWRSCTVSTQIHLAVDAISCTRDCVVLEPYTRGAL